MSAKLSPVMLGMPCWSRLIVACRGAALAGAASASKTNDTAAAILPFPIEENSTYPILRRR
jgi:hypothetical protein